MTKYAEVIYETGDKSVVSYETEDQLISAVTEQHRRAKAGEDAGPQTGRPAERVSRVLLYDEHPADAYTNTISATDLASLASGLSVGGEVSQNELVSALSAAASPITEIETDRHASLFKAKETSELEPASWGE